MKRLKNFFISIYKTKYYVLFFLLIFIIAFRLLLPDEKIINVLFEQVEANFQIKIKPENPKLRFIPMLKVSFDKANISTIEGLEFNVEDGSIGVDLISLLIMSPSAEISGKIFDGKINLKIFDIPMKDTPQFLDLELTTENINLAKIIKLYPLPVSATGFLTSYATGVLSLTNIIYSDLNAQGSINDIKLDNLDFMSIKIPNLNLGDLNFNILMSKLNINFSQLTLGSKDKDIHLDLTGATSLKGNYNLDVKFIMSEKLYNPLKDFLVIIQNTKSEDGYYKFKANGTSRAPIPQITPIK